RLATAAGAQVNARPAPRRDERLQPEKDQVSGTGETQREKRGPRGDQQCRNADRSGEPPDELTADDAGGGRDACPTSPGDGVPHSERKVRAGRNDQHDRDDEERDHRMINATAITPAAARPSTGQTFNPRWRRLK